MKTLKSIKNLSEAKVFKNVKQRVKNLNFLIKVERDEKTSIKLKCYTFFFLNDVWIAQD